MTEKTDQVLGVDGCRKGWIGVFYDGHTARACFAPRLEEMLRHPIKICAVDMPIGFPERDARTADSAARQVLGKRKSSIFPVPTRAAVYTGNFADALAINRQRTDPPKGFPKQIFGLFTKMREVDAIAQRMQLYEVHPEVSFVHMNGMRPLEHAKKTAAGVLERQAILRDTGFPDLSTGFDDLKTSGALMDDLLDACAVAWSAWRVSQAGEVHYPAHEERDGKGVLMRIHA
jgi:predicted RNase H-like nuclease